MRSRLPSPFLASLVAIAACGGGGEGGRESGQDSGITVSGTDGTDDATAGTAEAGTADGTGQDSTTGNCTPDHVCGDVCCNDGEVCVGDGLCELDCGDQPPCGGADPVCCEGGDVCYIGQCVTPGGACSAAKCATQTESDCEADEICDPRLGLCVPNFANPACAFEPEPGVFDPVPRFSWGVRANRACAAGCQKEEACNNDVCEPTWTHVSIAADDYPEWHQVVMTPMVADLDGDCIPEIVFNSYRDSTYTTNGILRAIRGDTGAKVWSLGDAGYRTDPGSHPAIGDIDGDGLPEVIVPGEGTTLLAVRGNGMPLWESASYNFGGKSGGPAIANFDGAGNPEIAFGRAVFDSTGAIAWQAAAGATGASGGFGPLACVADLDGDDRPELIAGATVYTFTGLVGVDFAGQSFWTGTPADGFCGVADFDGDEQPEVVLVSSGNFYILDGLTGAQLGTIPIPLGGAGGPPNIADFDGDGVPDIGTAANDRYAVVQFDGMTMTQLWVADTKDASSERTGSSVFDFDGDGRSEVIYADEWYLRIYPGTEPDCAVMGPLCDGQMTDPEVLFIDINSSRTRTENPIVADVDGDFKAEIILSTNNESSQGAIGDAGIEVFEDRLDNWVATVPIWNQHTYHVTNVEADGAIPAVEPPNWSTPPASPHNSYRRNTQGELASLCAPDLVPADLAVDTLQCPALELSVKVVNQGCLGVGPGVNVAFYDVQHGLLGVVQTANAIPAGGAETVQLSVPDPGDAPHEIYVVVDDDGMGNGALNECDEDNNASVPEEVCQPVG